MESSEEIPPSATVYIKNLPEKMNVNKLILEVREMFSVFGEIVEIVAKKNLKARGQAFVVYDNIDSAKEAIDELQGFDVGGKEIKLAFAKGRSDATVKREDGDEGLEVHKRQRLAEKERRQAVEAAQAAQRAANASKRAADATLADRPAKKAAAAAGAVADEFLPPNKTLVLRDLPEDYTQQILSTIFSRYQGFKEVRMVPGRAGLAFAEYETEDGAIMAKSELNGEELGGRVIKVTFQRQ